MSKEKKSFNALTVDELTKEIAQSKEQIFRLKIQKATGQLPDTAAIKRNRKSLAQALTALASKSSATQVRK